MELKDTIDIIINLKIKTSGHKKYIDFVIKNYDNFIKFLDFKEDYIGELTKLNNELLKFINSNYNSQLADSFLDSLKNEFYLIQSRINIDTQLNMNNIIQFKIEESVNKSINDNLNKIKTINNSIELQVKDYSKQIAKCRTNIKKANSQLITMGVSLLIFITIFYIFNILFKSSVEYTIPFQISIISLSIFFLFHYKSIYNNEKHSEIILKNKKNTLLLYNKLIKSPLMDKEYLKIIIDKLTTSEDSYLKNNDDALIKALEIIQKLKN